MNSLRALVSGNRMRMQKEDFNLDLTYITSNIIAMSYPSSGIEAMYRNPIEHVSAYLNKKHPDKYLIINTSERNTYDAKRYF